MYLVSRKPIIKSIQLHDYRTKCLLNPKKFLKKSLKKKKKKNYFIYTEELSNGNELCKLKNKHEIYEVTIQKKYQI